MFANREFWLVDMPEYNVSNLKHKKPVLPVQPEEENNSQSKNPEKSKGHKTSSNKPQNLSQSRCQLHQRDITIYMDSFAWLTKHWMGELYEEYKEASQKCPPLPGGGVCTYVLDDKLADGILFYCAHSDLNYVKQYPQQVTVSLTEEQEGGPYVRFPSNFHHDVKVSYVRSSNIPIPFICERERALQLYEMGQPKVPKGRKKIVGMISNCGSKWRNDYIEELMKHIEVDQLGGCYSKTHSNISTTRKNSDWEAKKLEFLRNSHYKYILAFENNVAPDYVTEKVFHGLLIGLIPIYYGDRAVFDYIPGNHSIIFAPDYTPQQLADYIKQIDNNDELYAKFFNNWDLKKMSALHDLYCYEHFTCRACRKTLEVKYHQEGCTDIKLMDHGDH